MQPTLLETTGRDDLALVHLLQLTEDPRHLVETVDSVDPRYPRHEKSVVIISTQFGCPVGCLMCEAGGVFHGNLSAEQMLAQVRFVYQRRPEILSSRKLKVHLARMGEPALNAAAVLETLERLPEALPAAALMPCVATMAPRGCEPFLEALGALKRRRYAGGRFQLQVSLNSTDDEVRQRIIPYPHLDLEDVAEALAGFWAPGDRKVALNIALDPRFPVEVPLLREALDPARYLVKLTPVNPTLRGMLRGLRTLLSAQEPQAGEDLVDDLVAAGYEAVVSIGEPEEISIGSNCGQLVRAHRTAPYARP